MSCVEVEVVIFPRVSPKNTILFAGVLLKPAPLIVTEVPIGPLLGEKLVIEGCANKAAVTKVNKHERAVIFIFNYQHGRQSPSGGLLIQRNQVNDLGLKLK